MSKQNHTAEPWVCNENEYDDYIWGPNREMIAESRGTGEGLPQSENRRRIVACVNACKEIDNATLEAGAIVTSDKLFFMEKQRDELLAALELLNEGEPCNCLEGDKYGECNFCHAREVIAKVKGGQ